MNQLATSKYPICADDGNISLDHCPGIYTSTPFVQWVADLVAAKDAGFPLPLALDAPYCLIESLSLWTRVNSVCESRAKVAAMEQASKQGDNL